MKREGSKGAKLRENDSQTNLLVTSDLLLDDFHCIFFVKLQDSKEIFMADY